MRVTTLFNKLLNLQGLWVTGFAFGKDDLVLSARPRRRRLTCPRCGKSQFGKRKAKKRSDLVHADAPQAYTNCACTKVM